MNTEKAETLREIIAYCEKKINYIGRSLDIIADYADVSDEVYSQLQGQVDAYEDIALKCINASGHMKEDDTNGD